MDAISLLKADHRAVDQLFKRFEKAGTNAHAEKREIVDRIIEELAKHAVIEEQIFYPVIRATVPRTEDLTLESLEEHHIVKWVLSELDGMHPEDERFTAKVTVLMENVRHHVQEEEGDLFPKVRDELGRNALNDLGDALAQAKQLAPTHPHPRSPDTPPGNIAMGTAAAVADRISDTLSGLAQGGVSAVGDLIATVTGRKKPRTAPTGSTVARRTATRTRARASDATERAIQTTRDAKEAGQKATKRTAKRTKAAGRTASEGTKRTASTARRGAASTARTARSGARAAAGSARSTARSTAGSARSTAKRTASAASRGSGTAKRASTGTRRTARKSTAKSSARS